VRILAAEAALECDPERAIHAVALDPLTSAVLTLAEIREMCAEMLDARHEWLPGFAGKRIAPRPLSSIPPDCQAVDVPLDPALAIGKRFGAPIEPSRQ
jgi:alpha-galactosidase